MLKSSFNVRTKISLHTPTTPEVFAFLAAVPAIDSLRSKTQKHSKEKAKRNAFAGNRTRG
jgi:hypothetical protein